MIIPAHIAARSLARMRTHERAALVAFSRHPATKRVVRERVKRADPFSIGVTIITAFEAVSGYAVGFEAASAVGSIFLAGAAISASAALSLMGAGGAPESDLVTEIRLNNRIATPSKRIIYGRTRTGGDMFFEAAVAPYLYHGFMYSSREIDGFERVDIGTDIISIFTTSDSLPVDQIITPQGKLDDTGTIVSTPDYATNLRISLRLGATDQLVDSIIDTDFPSLSPNADSPEVSNFRQRGISTGVFRYEWPGTTFDERQAMWGDGQAPNPFVIARGVKIYDPRDPTQDRDDDSTWKWSNNAALVQADYLRQSYGGRIDPDDIDWDRVREAANYDDELVGTTTAGEFIKRHTIDGVVTLNQPPNQVLQNMLSANRGFVCEQAGFVWVSSSKPQDSVLTIHDGLLTGGVDFQPFKAKRDQFNRIMSRFVASERNYQEADGPILNREDLQDTDGELLAATLTLPFTLDNRRVQRLQKAFLETSRIGRPLVVQIDLKALAEARGPLLNSAVTFESELFSPANGTYRVQTVGFTEDYSSLELQLIRYDPSIETDWVPETDEKPFEVEDLDVAA